MKRICVYLGSNPGFDNAYAEATKALARELAARKIGLVFGGLQCRPHGPHRQHLP